MAMETTERSRVVVRAQQVGAPLPPVEQHDPPLPCPRCTSINTKFCYYNNYNFSQPRHFCKSCRRYWTHGGTLRDIPVGGGSRKTAKRSRTCPSSTVVVSSSLVGPTLEPPQAAPTTTQGGGTGGPVFVSVPSSGGGGFTSLLSGGGPGGGGLLALSGFGIGLGLDDIGYGLGRGVWAFPQYNDVVGGGGVGSGGSDRSDTWQMESGGEVVGFVNVGVGGGADCFTALPELAISTSANGLK